MPVTWTKDEIQEFDRVTLAMSSHDQVIRIGGRLDIQKLISKHGKEKCDAMFAHLDAGGEPIAKQDIKLPGGQYYAADGCLMNADGTRSIFCDVDEV